MSTNKQPGHKLFEMEQPEMSRLFLWAGQRLRVPSKMGLCMYMLRHSGASHDFGTKSRTLLEIKRRGRWRSDDSVRRYEKGGRLSSQLRSLGDSLRAHSLNCARSIDKVVGGRRSPLKSL